jgi:hypothetical protein
MVVGLIIGASIRVATLHQRCIGPVALDARQKGLSPTFKLVESKASEGCSCRRRSIYSWANFIEDRVS